MIKKYQTQMILLLMILIFALAYIFLKNDIIAFISFVESENTHPLILILAFLILPLMFFPITALMILIGLRFDTVYGIIIVFMLMPAHLLFSYFAMRSFFRARIRQFAEKKYPGRFQIPKKHSFEYAFLFMALPGLPYAVKNYLLPLSGISFWKYFLTAWLVQGVMGIPFVILGDAAAKWSIPLFSLFFLLFLIAWLLTGKIRKKYEHTR
ncbi:MAG: VTT domain-containing protein [Desulfococcaceae bacterium]|jgi:uncharacterized membrane protein YdjX (TVP38/TMEM64 family)|nr:VTT domain-containing protein [Desulfococcaceae bacterium]